MNTKLLVVTALVCGLAACRDPGSGTDMVPGSSGNSGAQEVAAARDSEPVRVRRLERSLPGNISELPFDYHVSLDRDTGQSKDGHLVRETGIEFLESSHKALEPEITRLVERQGGAVEDRRESGDSIRMVYYLPGGTRMLAWYRPGPPPGEAYATQHPSATGSLYLAWPYSEKEAQ